MDFQVATVWYYSQGLALEKMQNDGLFLRNLLSLLLHLCLSSDFLDKEPPIKTYPIPVGLNKSEKRILAIM